MITWNVDPTLLELGSVEVRWYGLLFALGLILLGPIIEEKIWKREGLSEAWLNSLFIHVVIGTVVGARLGHVLFYDPAYYLANPSKIIAVWEGGLASHGGALGVLIAIAIYSHRVTGRSMLWTLDRLAVPTGLVAMFIRLGNLMNSEIFGRPTDLPWGFRFMRSAEYHKLVPDLSTGCHPTQLYEALAYLLTFILCMWLYWRRDAARRYQGLITGVLFLCVFGSRIFIESVKNVQEPWELDLIASYGLNMGQILSIPFVLVGASLLVRALIKARAQASPSAQ